MPSPLKHRYSHFKDKDVPPPESIAPTSPIPLPLSPAPPRTPPRHHPSTLKLTPNKTHITLLPNFSKSAASLALSSIRPIVTATSTNTLYISGPTSPKSPTSPPLPKHQHNILCTPQCCELGYPNPNWCKRHLRVTPMVPCTPSCFKGRKLELARGWGEESPRGCGRGGGSGSFDNNANDGLEEEQDYDMIHADGSNPDGSEGLILKSYQIRLRIKTSREEFDLEHLYGYNNSTPVAPRVPTPETINYNEQTPQKVVESASPAPAESLSGTFDHTTRTTAHRFISYLPLPTRYCDDLRRQAEADYKDTANSDAGPWLLEPVDIPTATAKSLTTPAPSRPESSMSNASQRDRIPSRASSNFQPTRTNAPLPTYGKRVPRAYEIGNYEKPTVSSAKKAAGRKK